MIGNTYKFENKKVLIYDVRIKGNIASLVTDHDVIEVPIDGLEDYLPDFKFIKSNQLVRRPEIAEMVISSGSLYQKLQSTLMDTLEKVQKDKDYIPQAQAINDTIKQFVELEKVKVSTIQLLK